MVITPGEPSDKRFFQLLTGSIAPRPIALASTIDKEGRPNLAPFSFFNFFGSDPPLLIFSPITSVRRGSAKHTLENIYETMEVTINMVCYAMIRQTSLAACEYPKEVNEFRKSGFTPLASHIIKPWRVKESPVNYECSVQRVIETGPAGGAGNLVVCEVLLIHVREDILAEDGYIDPHKIDLVGSMGLNYYCRASGSAVHIIPKPNNRLSVGVDALPAFVKRSEILSANDLGQLADVTQIPAEDPAFSDARLSCILRYFAAGPGKLEQALHSYAHELLQRGRVLQAWQVLLKSRSIHLGENG